MNLPRLEQHPFPQGLIGLGKAPTFEPIVLPTELVIVFTCR